MSPSLHIPRQACAAAGGVAAAALLALGLVAVQATAARAETPAPAAHPAQNWRFVPQVRPGLTATAEAPLSCSVGDDAPAFRLKWKAPLVSTSQRNLQLLSHDRQDDQARRQRVLPLLAHLLDR